MNEVKQPKRPLFVYYLIVLAVVLLFNLLIGPAITQRAIKEVDYGTPVDEPVVINGKRYSHIAQSETDISWHTRQRIA